MSPQINDSGTAQMSNRLRLRVLVSIVAFDRDVLPVLSGKAKSLVKRVRCLSRWGVVYDYENKLGVWVKVSGERYGSKGCAHLVLLRAHSSSCAVAVTAPRPPCRAHPRGYLQRSRMTRPCLLRLQRCVSRSPSGRW
jgi:hypothetical protein